MYKTQSDSIAFLYFPSILTFCLYDIFSVLWYFISLSLDSVEKGKDYVLLACTFLMLVYNSLSINMCE